MKFALSFGSTRSSSSCGACLLSHGTLAAMLSMATTREAHAQPDARACLAASHASIEALDRHDVTQEYDQLSTCADEVCPNLVKEECERRRQSLMKRITVFRFEFTNSSAVDLRGLSVSVDGKPDQPYAVASPLALSAGRHELLFRTSSARLPHTVDVEGKGEAVELKLSWPTVVVASATQGSEPPSQTDAPEWDSMKTTAIVLGGVGVASLAVAGGYTLSAMAKRDRAAQACPDVCSTTLDVERWAAAERAGSNATIWATVGWIGFTAGGVLLAVAFHADTAGEPAIAVGLGPSNFVLSGRF